MISQFFSMLAWKPLASSEGTWLQVEFNTIMSLSTMRLKGLNGGDEFLTSFQAQTSLDGETFETVQQPWGTVRVR